MEKALLARRSSSLGFSHIGQHQYLQVCAWSLVQLKVEQWAQQLAGEAEEKEVMLRGTGGK